MARERTKNSERRDVLRKRLKRRGIITSAKGISTDELENLWWEFKDSPTIAAKTKARTKSAQEAPTAPTNFERFRQMLEAFYQNFNEYFSGTWRDAWIYADEIRLYWQRISPEKMNNDANFTIAELIIHFAPPSDWSIGDEHRMDPLDTYDWLRAKWGKYEW